MTQENDELDSTAPLVEESFRTGSNQRGMRNYNERLIIDTIRRTGSRSKADVARMTQLSAQTVTVIVNRLIKDGLLMKMDSVRGKVGQPSTPIALHPNGAVSIGVKVGRRSLDVLALSFTQEVIVKRSLRYAYPDPNAVLKWLDENLTALMNDLTDEQRSRLLGIGVATPTGLHGWESVIGAPKGVMAAWVDIDLAAVIAEKTGLPVYMLNDGSSACLAQISLSETRTDQTFLYLYLATFVGGGLVVNGHMFEGKTGNAGALGSLPLSVIGKNGETPQQLIEVASFNRLEDKFMQMGLTPNEFDAFLFDPAAQPLIDAWIAEAAPALAMCILSAQSILDMDAAVIDGSVPPEIMNRLCRAIETAMASYNVEGISLPPLSQGTLGYDARALGAAILPLRANFNVDQAALLIAS